MTADRPEPKLGLARSPRRKVIAPLIRTVTSVIGLVAIYYLVPLRDVHDLSSVARLVIGSLVFGLLAVWQVRTVMRSSHPVQRAIQVLAVVVPLFLLVFAATYYEMQAANSSSFSSTLDRTDALYFTVTVFSTVGFGDIVARTDAARIAVTLQMVSDIVVIGVFVQVIVKVAQRRKQQQRAEPPAENPTDTQA